MGQRQQKFSEVFSSPFDVLRAERLLRWDVAARKCAPMSADMHISYCKFFFFFVSMRAPRVDYSN